MLGPRVGHVRQAPFLRLAVDLHAGFVVLLGIQPPLLVRLVQVPLRKVGPVPAQGPRQGGSTAAPAGVPVAGESSGVHSRDKHGVPFQSLGRMDRQQLYCLPVHVACRRFQPVFLRRRSLQPGQESENVYSLGGAEEPGGRILEGIKVAARLVDADPRAGCHFDVEQHGPLHLPQERGEVVAQVAAQLPQFDRQPGQPAARPH